MTSPSGRASQTAANPGGRAWRIVRVVAANVLLALLGGELVAYAVARLRLHVGYDSIALQKEEVLGRLPRTLVDGSLEADQAPPDNIERVLHPFFGFTFRPKLANPETNNMGFFAPVDYPYRKRPRELVVGIFGGSWALSLRCPTCIAALQEPLMQAVAAKGYDTITVLQFAQGAWKEPQSIFCFLYYMDTVDVALVADGFNEISQIPLPDGARPGGYPWDFPAPAFYRNISGSGLRVGDAATLTKIGLLRKAELRLTRLASRGPLARSMMVHLLWRAAITAAERRVARYTETLPQPSQRTYDGLFPQAATLDQSRQEYFDRYAGWIEASYQAARGRGKLLFHFIQPNQYVAGSKRFSAREQEVCLQDDNVRTVVAKYYPWLIRMSSELRERGVPSFDLTMALEDVTETYYRDSCCHMNRDGMTAMAGIIAMRVVESRLLDDLPEATSVPEATRESEALRPH